MDINTLTLNISEMLANFREGLLEIIPKLILSVFVLALGYLIGRLVRFLIIRLLLYLGKLLSQRLNNPLQSMRIEESAKFIGTSFFWLVLLCVFVLISDILGLSIITTWMESILRYSPNIIAAILIVLIAIVVGRTAAELISSASMKIGVTYGNTLGTIVYYSILITAIIIAIDQIGIEVALLINLINIILAALLFGSALAFGLGARTSVSNILAAFYVRKMYKVGDLIKINDIQGRITRIEATAVLLDTKNGQVVIPAKAFNESNSFLINKDHQ